LNLRALTAFRIVALDGSASSAARKMNLSQPAVSRHIAQLEHELKLQLFHRRGRRLVLTEEGHAFFRDADRILAGLGELPAIAAAIREGLPKSLHVVVMPRVAHGWIAPAVARFQAGNPGIAIGLEVLRRHDMETWLVGRRHDLGIGALPARHSEIDTFPMIRARVCALAPKGHPLARKRGVAPTELLRHRLIGLSPGLLPRQQVDDLFLTAGVAAEYAIETTSTSLACNLAVRGAGVAIVDVLSASSDLATLAAIPIHPAKWMTFGLLVPKRTTLGPLAERLIECLRATRDAMLKRGMIEAID